MARFNSILITFFIALYSSVASSEQLCRKSCTFVLKSDITGKYTVINPERANNRMTPWSTFKIPNSLIALDSGLVRDTEVTLTFDSKSFPIQKWWPEIWYKEPLSLRYAFKYSALPIYQTIAQKIGAESMSNYMKEFNYGNQDISSGIDSFWLNESIKISAIEQVNFLQRFYKEQLPVSKAALSKLKSIMLVDSTDEYKLYAKTGAGGIEKDKYLGWYVGFVENSRGVYYFALNIDGPSFRKVGKIRIEAVMEQLKLANII